MQLISVCIAIIANAVLSTASPLAATTTSASAPSGCTTTLLTPTPTTLHCGDQGTLAHPQTLGQATTISRSHSSPIVACRNRCLDYQNNLCISFSFNQHNNKCTLYSKTLNSQGFRRAAGNGIVNYNRHCFGVSCGSSPGSSTCTDNAVQMNSNPSFEDLNSDGSDDGWSFSSFNTENSGSFVRDPANAYDGSVYAEIDINDNYHPVFLNKNVSNIVSGTQYAFNFYYRLNQTSSAGFCGIVATLNGEQIATLTVPAELDPDTYYNFANVTTPYVPNGTSAQLQFEFYCYTEDETPFYEQIFIDEVTLASEDTCDGAAFSLMISSPDAALNGQYIQVTTDSSNNNVATATPDVVNASSYTLNANGTLLVEYNGASLYSHTNLFGTTNYYNEMYFTTSGFSDRSLLFCQITQGANAELICGSESPYSSSTAFYYCTGSSTNEAGLYNSQPNDPTDPACYATSLIVQ